MVFSPAGVKHITQFFMTFLTSANNFLSSTQGLQTVYGSDTLLYRPYEKKLAGETNTVVIFAELSAYRERLFVSAELLTTISLLLRLDLV